MFIRIAALIKRDFNAEWRKSQHIGATFLYALSAFIFCFFLYSNGKSFCNNWDVFYWILVLFSSINAVTRNFSSESKGKMLSYYLLINATEFCNAKIIYNFFTILTLSIINLLLSLLFGVFSINNFILFGLLVVFASLGISIIMVFVNLLAIKSDNNYTLTALLSFPLLLPLLFLIYKTSTTYLSDAFSINLLMLLFSIMVFDAAIYILTIVLAPFIWTD